MRAKQQDTEFVAYLVDLLQAIGPVSAKRMFGGYGIFLDHIMFALVDQRTLYFKADQHSEHAFQQLGLQKYTYYKQGRASYLSYYEAPEEALEDQDMMRYWGNLAFDAALRATAKKKK